jgi:hypothetical protein
MRRDYFLSGVITASLIISIIVAWMAILVPSHAATSIDALTTSDVTALTVSNTARKGDRLVTAHGKPEHAARPDAAPATKSATKVLVGCDPAFSKLVRSESLVVRCVTSSETSVKLAAIVERQ